MDFVDKYNVITGSAIAILTMILGPQWYLFAGFLIFNIADWLTGWYRSRLLKQESSKVGLSGIAKKTLYWVLLIVSFMFPYMFIQFGKDVIGINLSFLTFVGWLTLGMLIINEARSILENLVQCGVKVPNVLINGLSITEKLLNAKSGEVKNEQSTNGDENQNQSIVLSDDQND